MQQLGLHLTGFVKNTTLQFLKAHKIADLSIYSMSILFNQ